MCVDNVKPLFIILLLTYNSIIFNKMRGYNSQIKRVCVA